MSYVDEVIEQVVAQNPAEPEFHQAVKEVLESLKSVVGSKRRSFQKRCSSWTSWNASSNSVCLGRRQRTGSC